MGYIKLSGLKRLEGMIKNDALLYVVQDGQSKKMKYADFKAFLGGLDSAGFLGIATPSTEPTQDGFYIAKEVGIYTNFGGFEIPAIGNNFAFVYSYGATKGGILIDLSSYDDTDIQNTLNDIRDEIDNLKITDLNDVVSGSISQNQFLVGTENGEAEFRKLHAKDVRIGAGYQSGEYVVTWNYGTNNWGSGTLVTTNPIENSIAKRDARGRLIAEAGTGEKHVVNYGQLPFKLFESENEAQSYLLGGLAKYGQLIFLQTGPQKGRMLQVNETLDGYNTLFDYELNLSSLTDLNDFPNAYTDAAGKVLMVNPTSSGVQFKSIDEIDGIATYDSNGNLTATEATTNENVPTLGQVVRLLEDITVGAVPEATNENFGIVKYDNTTIKKNNEGQLYVVDEGGYILPPASASTLGGIKVGSGLTITPDGVLSAAGGGGGVNIYNTDGTLNGDRNVDLGSYNLTFSNGNIKAPKYSLEVQADNITPNTIWAQENELYHTNNSGVSKKLLTEFSALQEVVIITSNINLSNNMINKNILFDNGASNLSLIVPSSLPENFIMSGIKVGAGRLTIVGGAGVTINQITYTDVVHGVAGSRFMLSRVGSSNTFNLYVANYE